MTPSVINYLLFVLSFHSGFVIIKSHPQCLDRKPPFAAASRLQFCSDYAGYGCCTNNDDHFLQEEYTYIYSMLSAKLRSMCGMRVQDILCQQCSPFSFQLYDAEGASEPQPLPSLCSVHCRLLYQECKDVIPYLTLKPSMVASLVSPASFCAKVNYNDTEHCYPRVLTNMNRVREVAQAKFISDICLCLEEFTRHIRNPIAFKSLNDGSYRVFVAEQIGTIYMLFSNKKSNKVMFLNIRSKLSIGTRMGDKRGLLNMEFHPQFNFNGKFYILYTALVMEQTSAELLRLSEFRTINNKNQPRVDYSYERVIIQMHMPDKHNLGGEVGIFYVHCI